jgi:hypothetical protein
MLKINTSWEAVYDDRTSLLQFPFGCCETKYTDIDRARLIQFIIHQNGKPAVIIHLGPHKKLIYRIRRAMNNRGEEEAVCLAGWQERKNGKNIQMISFIFENGHIEIVDRFYEDHLWFYSINFLEEEKI